MTKVEGLHACGLEMQILFSFFHSKMFSRQINRFDHERFGAIFQRAMM